MDRRKRRALSLLMSLLLVCQLALGLAAPARAAQTTVPKILLVGNSFAKDVMHHLNKILIKEGVSDFTLGYLYYSGCSLAMHAEIARDNARVYTYYKSTGDRWRESVNTTLRTALRDEKWDIVCFQQQSYNCTVPESFDDALEALVDYVDTYKTNPEVKLGWHMTWSYAARHTQSVEFTQRFGRDPLAMFRAIVSTTQEKISPQTFTAGIIPTGTAIQNARTSYFGDGMDRDGYHLNDLGRLITAYVWYAYLTGKPLEGATLEVSNLPLSATDRAVIRESVNNAVAHPYEVTPSKYPTPDAAPAEETETPHGDDCPAKQYTDLDPDAWYHEAVDYVLTHGIMGGYSADKFGPDDTLTRAMIVQILYNYEKKPEVTAENHFPDVAESEWYCNAVRWGASRGVVSGYGSGKFGPDDDVTLEQVGVILWNYAGKPHAESDLESVGTYNDWAAEALSWCEATGILKNVPITRAIDPATRAQTAQMLVNYLNLKA